MYRHCLPGPASLPWPCVIAVGCIRRGGGGGSSRGSSRRILQASYVYGTNKQACVKASSGLFDDEQLYQQGRALALGGRFEALGARRRAEQNDSMVLTMIGYGANSAASTRRDLLPAGCHR
jgi:hypothetical protein